MAAAAAPSARGLPVHAITASSAAPLAVSRVHATVRPCQLPPLRLVLRLLSQALIPLPLLWAFQPPLATQGRLAVARLPVPVVLRPPLPLPLPGPQPPGFLPLPRRVRRLLPPPLLLPPQHLPVPLIQRVPLQPSVAAPAWMIAAAIPGVLLAPALLPLRPTQPRYSRPERCTAVLHGPRPRVVPALVAGQASAPASIAVPPWQRLQLEPVKVLTQLIATVGRRLLALVPSRACLLNHTRTRTRSNACGCCLVVLLLRLLRLSGLRRRPRSSGAC